MKEHLALPGGPRRLLAPLLICIGLLSVFTVTLTAPTSTLAARNAAPAAQNLPPGQAGEPQQDAAFWGLPLSFVPNAGQTDLAVRFQAHGFGGTIFFATNEVVLALPGPADEHGPPEHAVAPVIARLRFEGAAPVEMTTVDPLPGKANYLVGASPAGWRTDLPTYGGIVYRQLYPGIDLQYEGVGGALKSTFLVAPGADPARIRWRYDGAAGRRVDEHGHLRVTLPVSATSGMAQAAQAGPPPELVEHAPVAWQDVGGQRVPVAVGYQLAPDGSIGLAVGAYDPSQPLTLDPTLSYALYLDGMGNDIVVGTSNYTFVTGYTESTTTFPVKRRINPGSASTDAFVVKLDSTGTVLWSSYIGGTNIDRGESVVVRSGNAFVAGVTFSDDFPTTTRLDSAPTGIPNADVFVAKLSDGGNSLAYSTQLGGSGDDYVRAIVERDGYPYIAGETGSTNLYPAGSAATRFGVAGSMDAFVAKLNTTGSALEYGVYVGGTDWDDATGITVLNGKAYVSGVTYGGSGFPATKQLGVGGTRDAFVFKLNTTGTLLEYNTRVGGSDYDHSSGIAVDGSGNSYITGGTWSSDFPVTNTVQQGAMCGSPCNAAFVAKINVAGTALVYSSYLNGNGVESGDDIAINSSGNAYVTGYTASTNFPTANALQGTNAGGRDVFLAMLSKGGQALIYSSYLGGSRDDSGVAIALFGGYVHLTGYTYSTDFPTPNNVSGLNTLTGGVDAFVAKIQLDGESVFGVQTDAGTILADAITNTVGADVDWVRYHGVLWDQVEPDENVRDWSKLGQFELDMALLNDKNLTPVVVVFATPDWAQAWTGKRCGPMKRTSIPAFANFMRDLVNRYDGVVEPGLGETQAEHGALPRVQYWEIWNEPDARRQDVLEPNAPYGCWGSSEPVPGEFSAYSGGDYYGEVLQQVYQPIKTANPAAQVVIGGLALDCDPYYPPPKKAPCEVGRFLEGIMEATGGRYFDVVAYHAYPGRAVGDYDWDVYSTFSDEPQRKALGLVRAKADVVRYMLRWAEADKPIMMNEGALHCGADNCPSPTYSVTVEFREDQANYLLRLYTRGWASNLASVNWYTITGPGWRQSGLLDNKQQPRPAYNVLDYLTSILKGGAYVGSLSSGSTYEGYRFINYDKDDPTVRYEYRIYWTNTPATAVVSRPSQPHVACGKYGNTINWDGTVNFEPVVVKIVTAPSPAPTPRCR